MCLLATCIFYADSYAKLPLKSVKRDWSYRIISNDAYAISEYLRFQSEKAEEYRDIEDRT